MRMTANGEAAIVVAKLFSVSGVMSAVIDSILGLAATPADACSAAHTSLDQLFVQAEVIVRAEAVGASEAGVIFRTVERLDGDSLPDTFVIGGSLTDSFSVEELKAYGEEPVPYENHPLSRWLAACHSRSYVRNTEYVLFLKNSDPYWAALASTNAAIRGEDDPWLVWVREWLRADAHGKPVRIAAPYRFVRNEHDIYGSGSGMSRFFLDLDQDGAPELFLGATALQGNGGGIYHVFKQHGWEPTSYLGVVDVHPSAIAIETRESGIPGDLITYWHISSTEGHRFRYRFKRGRYLKIESESVEQPPDSFELGFVPAPVQVEHSDANGAWQSVNKGFEPSLHDAKHFFFDSATPASFVRYMELSGFSFGDPTITEQRAAFFLLSDFAFVEVFLVNEGEDFDIRRTNAYIEGTEGWEFMECEPLRDRIGLPGDTERVAYLRKWFWIRRVGRLVFVIPKCVEDGWERAEVTQARDRFIEVVSSYSLSRLEVLKRERTAADRLFAIVMGGRHELYEEARALRDRTPDRELTRLKELDSEFAAALHYMIEVRPKEEEEARRRAAEEAALFEKNYPHEIVPELSIAPDGLPHVIVALVNRSDSPVRARIYPEMLSKSLCNVHFMIWRPDADQPAQYRPYGIGPCPFYIPGVKSMLLQPGDSISSGYDLSGVLTDSGLYRIQAVVPYGGRTRTNVLEIRVPAKFSEEISPSDSVAVRMRAAELGNAEFRKRFSGYPKPENGEDPFEQSDGVLVRLPGALRWTAEKRIHETRGGTTTANAFVTFFDDARDPEIDVAVIFRDHYDGRTKTYRTYGEMWEEFADPIR